MQFAEPMTERHDKPKPPALSDVEGRPPPRRSRLWPAAAAACSVTSSSSSPLVIVVDAIAGEKGLLALLQARREYAALERSLERARAENAAAARNRAAPPRRPRSHRRTARRELGLIKPGEVLFIVKDIEKK